LSPCLAPLLHVGVEPVVARKSLVELVPAFLHIYELTRRNGQQYRGRVIRPAVHDQHIALPDAFQEPVDVLGTEAALQPRFGLFEKRRVVRQLLVAVPFVQVVEAGTEILLLLFVEVEVAPCCPQRDVVEFRIAEAHRAASR